MFVHNQELMARGWVSLICVLKSVRNTKRICVENTYQSESNGLRKTSLQNSLGLILGMRFQEGSSYSPIRMTPCPNCPANLRFMLDL